MSEKYNLFFRSGFLWASNILLVDSRVISFEIEGPRIILFIIFSKERSWESKLVSGFIGNLNFG
jgi:hypothetical protein